MGEKSFLLARRISSSCTDKSALPKQSFERYKTLVEMPRSILSNSDLKPMLSVAKDPNAPCDLRFKTFETIKNASFAFKDSEKVLASLQKIIKDDKNPEEIKNAAREAHQTIIEKVVKK